MHLRISPYIKQKKHRWNFSAGAALFLIEHSRPAPGKLHKSVEQGDFYRE